MKRQFGADLPLPPTRRQFVPPVVNAAWTIFARLHVDVGASSRYFVAISQMRAALEQHLVFRASTRVR